MQKRILIAALGLALAGTAFRLVSRNKLRASESMALVSRSELQLLQSQLSPHFLFNTLNTVSKKAYLEEAYETSDLLVSIADLLRYNLKQLDRAVTLGDELRVIRQYIQIQQTRFSDRLIYTEDIDQTLLGSEIPALTLQPIIENSIQHGFEGDRLFKIKIKIYHIEDDLVMLVSDNGRGFKKKKLKEIQTSLLHINDESQHIGLANCNRRIKLFYGNKYGITIDSAINKGTIVMLRCLAERT